MQLAEQQHTPSWSSANSPMVLGDIFSDNTSVVIWKRDKQANLSDYFEQVFRSLGMGINGIFHMDSLKKELGERLPQADGKQDVLDDIHLLSDMLTCLFECESVGLRLVPLSNAMCPSFHVDNIPVRLVSTYLGSATQWLPLEALNEAPVKSPQSQLAKTKFGKYYDKNHVQQMDTFDVGLLKGQAWQNHEHLAAVHRSCQLKEAEKRVLLTLDPM